MGRSGSAGTGRGSWSSACKPRKFLAVLVRGVQMVSQRRARLHAAYRPVPGAPKIRLTVDSPGAQAVGELFCESGGSTEGQRTGAVASYECSVGGALDCPANKR